MNFSTAHDRSSGTWRPPRLALFWSGVSLVTILYALMLPAIILPRRAVLAIVKSYVSVILWLLTSIFKVNWSIRGDIPSGPVLVAAKHQSAFETLILQHVLGDPAIILKRELLAIPLFGWVLWRLGHIGVDRSGDLDAARQLLEAARRAIAEGRPVLIFPEGSRRELGAPPDYKAGVELLYATMKVPCVPVAVNSGRAWPTKALTPGKGHITIEFLPPISPGMSRAAFGQRLQGDIEAATAALLQLPP